MADSAEKRTTDSKAIADKDQAKADAEELILSTVMTSVNC